MDHKILSSFFKKGCHLFIINIFMTEKSVSCGIVEKYYSTAVVKSSATPVEHQYLESVKSVIL